MSDVGWGSAQLNGHAEMATGSRPSNASTTTAAGISRSQDDATVEYFFQRPQSESGPMQPFGANKRWAVGDDSLISQGRVVTDMEREFRALSLDNDFSKKLWDVDSTQDGRSSGSDKGGSGIFSGSPWGPREGPWASPPDRSSVTSSTSQPAGLRRPGSFAGNESRSIISPPHPSEQAGTLGLDMAEYVLGRPSITAAKDPPAPPAPIAQRHAKSNFVGHGEGDADKKMKQAKTPSPFEAADKTDADKDSGLVPNGLDESVVGYGRITARQESPTIPIEDSDALGPSTSQPLHAGSQMGSGGSGSSGGCKQDEPFLDTPEAVAVAAAASGSSSGSGHGLQMDTGSMQQYGPLVLDGFPDYAGGYIATVDTAFGTSNFAISTMDYNQSQHIVGRPSQPVQQQQLQPPQPQQHAVTYVPQQQPSQQQLLQQQPLQQQQQQQQFAVQASVPQPSLGLGQATLTAASGTALQPTYAAAPSYVINSQDPYSIGIPIAAAQLHYVQTPWGIYPASILPATAVAPPIPQSGVVPQPQQAPGAPAAAAGAVQSSSQHQQQHLMLSAPRGSLQTPGGRPITPSQIGSGQVAQDVLVASVGHSHSLLTSQQQQQQTLQPQQGLPMAHPGLMDFAGYQFLPAAYYDQSGQLLVSNGRTIRLVSPGPVLINATAQQGFPQPGALAYHPVTGNVFATTGGMAGLPQQLPQQPQQQHPQQQHPQQQQQLMSYSSPAAVAAAAAAMTASAGTVPDYGLPVRRESYEAGVAMVAAATSAGDKYGRLVHHQAAAAQMAGQPQQQPQAASHMYGSGQAATMLGPLGLVQPPAQHQQQHHQQQPGTGQLTPPPQPPALLSGGGGQALGGFGLGNSVGPPRIYSAAPGAEAKYRAGMGTGASVGGGMSTGGHHAVSGSASASGMLPTSMFAGGRGLPKGVSKDPGGRSRLLEDFRNNRAPTLTLKDLVNHVIEFSQDQHGSRFIQQKLERATLQEKALIFGEIIVSAYSLMMDVFGNYVIQKFFDFGSVEQKQTLGQRLRGHVLHLSLQMYGCRVIQKALESLSAEMQVEIVKELDGQVIKCVKDQNGNHVVQKCIECVEPCHLQFILDAFRGQVFTLSTHPYGCRVIQRTLEHCTAAQTECVLKELHEHTERLVQDQYGNYVIQHVLEHGRADDRSRIVASVRGKVLTLSQHKFASNVIEKCVTHSNRNERASLIEEVMAENNGGSSASNNQANPSSSTALYLMMKDQYANYVVQRMLDVAEAAQRKQLVQKIRPHLATLRKYPYGKHIIAKLDKYLQKGGTGGGVGNCGSGGSPLAAVSSDVTPVQPAASTAIAGVCSSGAAGAL